MQHKLILFCLQKCLIEKIIEKNQNYCGVQCFSMVSDPGIQEGWLKLLFQGVGANLWVGVIYIYIYIGCRVAVLVGCGLTLVYTCDTMFAKISNPNKYIIFTLDPTLHNTY